MSEKTVQKQRYAVSTYELEKAGDALIFTFVPKDLPQEQVPGRGLKRALQFSAEVRKIDGKLDFHWSGDSDDPPDRAEMEAEIADRMKDREAWIDRVGRLVAQMEQWVGEMGWSTRRVDKRLDDARIGQHRVPALLMQQDIFRVLLEPIGRSSPGTDGVVDLYLMPAYDDIASLFFYGNQWHIHYNTFRGTNAVVPEPKETAVPLSKESLERVLTEMRQNAA